MTALQLRQIQRYAEGLAEESGRAASLLEDLANE